MITAITPVCNRSDLTHQLLTQNWQRYGTVKEPDIRWIVIDNGSTDNTPGVLKHWQLEMNGKLFTIRNDLNQGFGRANNQAFAEHEKHMAADDVVLFINNDVLVRGDYLSMIIVALADKEVLVGAQLLDYPTGWNKFGDILVTYLAGWCLAMRVETFKALGGFDERYTPADYEDADLCYSAQKADIPLVGLDLPLFHISEQTAIKVLPDRQSVTVRNRAKFAEKWGLRNEPTKDSGIAGRGEKPII